jgi:hypothetical protein
MKPQTSYQPSTTVHKELDQQIAEIKKLLNQLEPAERLQYTNEMIVKLLTGRAEKPTSTREKIMEKTAVNNGDLTESQKMIIDKLTKQTDNLFRASKKDDNF